MAEKKRRFEVDAVNGAILPQLLRFALPLALSGMLQLLYGTADTAIVGRFVGADALAAVGSNGPILNLMVNLFVGLSVGTSVAAARYFGARDAENIRKTVHTSMLVSLLVGGILMVLGISTTRPMLEMMATPPEVLPLAQLYLSIIYLGMPASMVYNFGAAILRAVGDTKRPMYFLALSGLLNLILNVVFVVCFRMGVMGVAVATVISQLVSAGLVVYCLMRADGAYSLHLRSLRLDKKILGELLRIGLPAGTQEVLFAISKVLIQSSVNSFGSVAMAGNAAANNLEGFIHLGQNSITQGAVTFAGQNIGARRYERVHRICLTCILASVTVSTVVGWFVYLMGEPLLGIYNSDAEVIRYGMIRLGIFATTYVFNGILEVLIACVRSMGASLMPTIASLMGGCVFRVAWIYTVFAKYRTLQVLYISYPVAWVLTSIAMAVGYMVIFRRMVQRENAAKG